MNKATNFSKLPSYKVAVRVALIRVTEYFQRRGSIRLEHTRRRFEKFDSSPKFIPSRREESAA